ncbi:Imm1 family immunity protein [Streptomyces sp. NPDC002262]|uniref:Imm1 family immunity protein n=1 Tax=Streptomyces sp. NPDC002262 TaxID=3154414 RepID=UPI00332CCAF6
MIVVGGTHRGTVYARSDEEIRKLVDHVMCDLVQGGITSDGFEQMPEYATICIVGDRYPEEINQRWPSNYLHVTVNTGNGYGALRWLTTNPPAGASGDHMSNFVWISKSLTPPDFDPRLILDPPTPLYYPTESALPVEKVRAVLEEFCRVRTGERPESIEWMLDPFSLDD